MQFHKDNTIPPATEGWIWVFGSNRGGRHGKGAAKVAHVNFGAEYGVGEGLTGQSYAIPTKSRNLVPLPISAIEVEVEKFLEFAHGNHKLKFYVTRVGCGLAGLTNTDIGPLFADAPDNCSMPEEWETFMIRR